jgi:predicted ATPase/DNA-binding winged helix-turn-helix (wHTH) protein
VTSSPSNILQFGLLTLHRDQRLLRFEGETVALGSRAMGILLALVDAGGELLSKDALIARVWPDATVDESTLRVHIAALRKAIGDGKNGVRYIVNEQSRGYRFVAPVADAGQPTPAPPSSTDYRLPGSSGRMVGRETIVVSLAGLMPERRLITLSGPGGIGKTTVAVAVAEALMASQGYRALFVDLAPISDPARVPSALAARLNVALSGADPLPDLIARLREAPALIILDNCEHVVDAAADLAEAIHRDAPCVHVLATSREPLRVDGEWVHRLQTLPSPGADAALSATEAAAFAAVQLFTERARAASDAFVLTDGNAGAVAEICRRLDGMPLALELAAARIDMMSAEDLAAHLDDRFSLLTNGRRTALPRQQTLRATLDWSYGLLPAESQVVLDRLGVFAGAFSLDSARAVASCATIDRFKVLEIVTDLAGKSLLAVDATGATTLYRMLDTTRAYAREKLGQGADGQNTARAHAEHCCALFGDTENAWEGRAKREWLADKSRQIDEVRAALAWSFSDEGDLAVAIRLIVASAPLWFHLSLPGEYLAFAERAVVAIPRTSLAGSVEEMELLAALGHALWHTRGPVPAMREAFARALQIADHRDDVGLRMRALWGLWAQAILTGDYAECAPFARQFKAPADQSGDIAAIQTADHMLALLHHFAGDQAQALRLVRDVLSGDATPTRVNHANHAQVDGGVAAHALLMRILWLQGFPDQALALAESTARFALETDHDLTICYGLAIGAIPVALWTGRDALARDWIEALLQRAKGHAVGYWEIWGQGFQAALSPSGRAPSRRFAMQAEVFATASPSLVDPAVFARLDEQPSLWCAPELLRLSVQAGAPDGDAVLSKAQALAQAQGALSWELRIALSLAETWARSGETERGRALVAAILERFSEGHDTPDQQRARALLTQI